jgi:hypothetical protein
MNNSITKEIEIYSIASQHALLKVNFWNISFARSMFNLPVSDALNCSYRVKTDVEGKNDSVYIFFPSVSLIGAQIV